MTLDDLARLHPGIRAAALADDGARLEAMRSKRWITHYPAVRALASLQDAFRHREPC